MLISTCIIEWVNASREIIEKLTEKKSKIRNCKEINPKCENYHQN